MLDSLIKGSGAAATKKEGTRRDNAKSWQQRVHAQNYFSE
jgi:hypothetical protein